MLEPPEGTGTLEQLLDGKVKLCCVLPGQGCDLCWQGHRGWQCCPVPSHPRGAGQVTGTERWAGRGGHLSGQGWTLSSFCQSFVKLPPCSSRRFQQCRVGGCVGSEAAPEIILRVRAASAAAGASAPPARPLLRGQPGPRLRGAASICLSPRLSPPPFLYFSFSLLHFPSR